MELYLLLLVGVVLAVFGAYVLLRHGDRPGGTIKWLGAEVSSTGAGLPLIVLGVGCIGFAVNRMTQDRSVSTALDTTTVVRSDSTCVAAWLAGIKPDRVHSVEVGMQGLEVIGAHQPLELPLALLLTDSGRRVGAVRVRLYRASNSSADIYKVEDAIDAGCKPVERMSNASRGGPPGDLVNWDTWRATLGTNTYDLRVGGTGNINVSLSRGP